MTEHIQVVPDKCRACRRCEVACIAAHHGMSFKEAMKHRDELVSRVQVVKADGFKTTVRCHQCPHAPCVNVCPTGALQQDEKGRIIMRVQYCVACKMCIAACPYGTITMETIGMPSVDGDDGETLAQRARREVAVRCDMCRAWRMENGKRITACMEACPAHALSLVLADGTVVEVPKPEKKAVEPASGGEAGAEAPKAEVAAEAVKAEAAPAALKAETAPAVTPETPNSEAAPAEAVTAETAPAAAPEEPKADVAVNAVEPVVEAAPEIRTEQPAASEARTEVKEASEGESQKSAPVESVTHTAPEASLVADAAPAEPTDSAAVEAAVEVQEENPAPAATDATSGNADAAPAESAKVEEAPTTKKAESAPKAEAPAAKKLAVPTDKKPAAKKTAPKAGKKTSKKGGKK